jgi:anti-sigma-K factor RskA
MSKTDRPGSDLARLAILYAAGELDEAAAAAFESRLADDQVAREALCAAVRLLSALNERSVPVPGIQYRERVHERLRASRDRRRVASRGDYRWQPVFWSVASAAAAAAILLSISLAPRSADCPEPDQPAVAVEAPVPPLEGEDSGDNAQEWPDLMSGRHLAEAVNDENRRKVRAESRGVVRLEDRAARLRAVPDYRQ